MRYQTKLYMIRAESNGNSALTKRDRSTFNVFEVKEEAIIAKEYLEKMANNVKFEVVEYEEKNN